MEKYDYRRAIIDDLKDWIVNDTDIIENKEQYGDRELLIAWICDEAFTESSITGNGYDWYDTEEKCSEYISNNFELLYEAAHEYCIDDEMNILIHQYEDKTLARYFDCTIRCYLLGECVEKALEELGL